MADWSCAKQLKPHLDEPIPHAFPPWIAPVPRQAQNAANADKQDQLQAVFSSASAQLLAQDLRQQPHESSQQHTGTASEGHTGIADESAAFLQPHQASNQQQQQQQQKQQQREIDLFLTHQQQSAGVTHQSGQQCTSAAAGPSLPKLLATPNAGHPAAPSEGLHTDQAVLVQSTCFEGHMQAPLPGCTDSQASIQHDMPTQPILPTLPAPLAEAMGSTSVQQEAAITVLQRASIDPHHARATCDSTAQPTDLAAACKELALSAAAHAQHRVQLQHLLQAQAKVSLVPHNTPLQATGTLQAHRAQSSRPLRHLQRLPLHRQLAEQQQRKSGRQAAGERAKPRRYRAVADNAAWPPGPLLPESQMQVRARSARGRPEKSALPADSPVAGWLKDRLDIQGPPSAECIPQHCQDAVGALKQHGQLLMVHNNVSSRSLPACANAAPVSVRGEAGAQRPSALSEVLVNSPASYADMRECLSVSAAAPAEVFSSPEPSFGTVHAMLLSLQLPGLNVAHLAASTAISDIVEGTLSPGQHDLSHPVGPKALPKSGSKMETKAASEGSMLTVGGAFELLGIGMSQNDVDEAPDAASKVRAPATLLMKLRAIQV